jgi:hypothetical protein
MDAAVQIRVRDVQAGVRPVHLRLPFRFGASTLTACPQLFARAEVEVAGRGVAHGWAAEMMVPKWFDKRSGFTPAKNVEHLALTVELARSAYTVDTPATPFGLFCRHYQALREEARSRDLTELSASFGQAVLDRAVLDAACRSLEISFFEAAQRNVLGLEDTQLASDMRGWDWTGWLAQLRPLRTIDIRHTVGLLDEIDTVRYGDDGLPVSLPAVIERYGHRYFKIKLGGDPARDMARLRAILATLARSVRDARYTLDANEQYAERDPLEALVAGLRDLPQPLYIEQPLPREASVAPALKSLRSPAPLLMDEADGALDAFAQGRAVGWNGVSSKGCKGLYKALINRARCERWNREEGEARYFMSAEDLTCQAGVSLQQDLALAALLGLTHSERNGHHYGGGFGSAPAAEARAFENAHADMYESASGSPRVRINAGAVSLDSLFKPGFAHSADPELSTLQPLATAAALL